MTPQSPKVTVRPARMADMAGMERVYAAARRFMAVQGNPTQWAGGYPARTLLEEDIRLGRIYVAVTSEEHIAGAFSFMTGDDPTYAEIDGAWPDNLPYGTIHRLASDGTVRGIADAALAFCRSLCDRIRIDTHADNTPMLRWIASRGFIRCGRIRVADGSPREAFALP